MVTTITGCLLMFHSPDGTPLVIDSAAIQIVRPVTTSSREHVSKGTHTVVYVGGKGVGVAETPTEVVRVIKECGR